ncbi:OprD family outer membrane porin [Pseudomonas aeruginosa]|uniref:OprD family outer membrane porin n=1 Tax=Pseudomonas aeruginosa TaxID=287 RepID=UPI00068C0793|nr:OprD family outer membrane porin [Pseudomonas aeruginosa]
MTIPILDKKLAISPLLFALFLPAIGQAEEEGLIDGSSFSLTSRNFYFRQDYRHGDFAINPNNDEHQDLHAEWRQGFIADFKSGYTPGTVGVGVDALGLLGVKLDGGNGHVGNGVGVPGIVARSGSDFTGEPKDEYSKLGAAIKVRLLDTELRYGDVRPTSPVLYASDIRLLPQTLRGLMFEDRSLPGLHLQGGRMTSSSDRTASGHDGDLGTVYTGRFKDAGYVEYVGGDYVYDDHLSFKLHTSELDNIWNQSFFRVDYRHALGESLSFNTGLNYYRTRDTGRALLGRIDNDSWSAHVGLSQGAHAVTCRDESRYLSPEETLEVLGASHP